MARILLVLILLFRGISSVLSQQIDYSIEQYNTDNGLPQNSIKAMEFDSMGRIWIGTELGLVCYDGRTFYKTALSELYPRIVQIYKARNQLWVLAEYGNVSRVNIKNRDLTPLLNPVYGNFALDLFEKITNINSAHILKNIPSKDPYYIIPRAIASQKLDKLFIFNIEQVYAINKERKYILPGAKEVIQKYLIDSHLLILNKNGTVLAYDENTLVCHPINQVILERKTIPAAEFIKTANLFNRQNYAIYHNTIYQIKLFNNHILCTPIIKHLPNINDVYSFLYIEKQNLYVIGSGVDGLFFIRAKAFETRNFTSTKSNTPYNKNNIISINNTYNIIHLENGDVLTQNAIIHPKDNRKPSHFVSKNTFQSKNNLFPFMLLTKDMEGNIWTQNPDQKQLWKFNPSFTKFKRYLLPNQKRFNSIIQIEKNHYILSNRESLSELKDHRLIYFPKEKLNPNNIEIHKLHSYNKEMILLLTNDGVYLYNFKKRLMWRNLQIPRKNFRSVYKMKSGRLLLGSYGSGYYVYDGKKCLALPIDKKQYLLSTHCFVPDKKGFLWISTNNGLFQVLESDIDSFADNKTKSLYYHYYDKSDGFLTNEFNGGSTSPYSIAPDGQISLSSIKGVVQFYPDSIRPLLPVSPIYITNIYTPDSTYHSISDKLELPNSSSEIKIEFESPYYGNKYNIHYEYRIIGKDAHWHAIDENKFNLSGLGSGKYIVEIRKLAGFGYSNYVYKRIELGIAKAYYEQRWFWLIAFGLFALIIYLITQYRVNKAIRENERLEQVIYIKTEELKEKNKKLQQTLKLKNIMSSVMIHDISGPLKMLSNLSELALENKDTMSQNMTQDYIREVQKATNGIYDYVYNILGWLKYRGKKNINLETFGLLNLTDGLLIIKMKKNRLNNEIQFINEIPENLVLKTEATILRIILTNILDNAYKYTKKGYIKLYHELEDSSDYFMIHCEDTGKGMSIETQNSILNNLEAIPADDNRKSTQLGYSIVNELLPLIDGILLIQSTINRGTKISIRLPKSIIDS